MQTLGQIAMYFFAVIGVIVCLGVLFGLIWAIRVYFSAKKTIQKINEDPVYAETVKDKLAKHHVEKFVKSQSKCCGDDKDANEMLFKGEHKRPDNDNSSGTSEGRAETFRRR